MTSLDQLTVDGEVPDAIALTLYASSIPRWDIELMKLSSQKDVYRL